MLLRKTSRKNYLTALAYLFQLTYCFNFFVVEHAQTKKCSTPEYMNLYFKVKGFYFKYVADLPQYKASIPEFPA